MIRRLLGNERGTAVLLTLGFMIFLLAMVGFAVDLAYQMVAIGELERSMEAAALAGAGKLGFNDTVFPTVRQWARQYGQFNPQHNTPAGTTISLDLNTGNTPSGNIVLGVWDGAGNFTPSVDGTIVNAVRCQFASQVQTSFLRVLGINTLPISASAIAVANPPQAPPPPTDTCLFPIGVGSCPFQGQNSSIGCGAAVTFITSSGKGDVGAGCLSPPCTNTAAWVSLDGSTPNAPYLKNAITGAGNGACPASGLQTGNDIPVSNGMIQSVMDTLQPIFVQHYNASSTVQVKDSNNNVTYSGKGWKVYVPVIQTACPAGAISGSHQIVGWTTMVMTQVINKGECAVSNDWVNAQGTNPWKTVGVTNGCTASKKDGSMRAIFAYYSCEILPSNPVPIPTPRTALGNRLRLVKMYQ
jgi:Putative Flp pilus-assembly TadE/G-like